MENYVSTANRHVSINLVLACIFWHAIATNGYELKYVSTFIKLPAPNFQMDKQMLFGSGVIFGSCKILSLNENKTTCLFGMQKKSNVGSSEHIRYCNVTHTCLHDKREWPGSLEQILAIDEDKAVFSIGYYSAHFDMSIIHFSDCRVRPIDVTGVTYPYPGSPFNGTFDIFAFKNGKSVRTVVDLEGNVIEEQRELKEPLRYLDAVVRSPAKGYLAVRGDGYGIQVEVVAYNSQGSMERLKRYILDQPTFDEGQNEKYTLSVADQLLSVCGQHESKVHCAQFDQNGVEKFEITIPYEKTSKKYLFNVYNMQGGGLLFISFKCVRGRFYDCSEIEDHVNATTFDATGRQVGTLQIKEVDKFPTNIRNSRLFVNEKKEICLSSIGGCHENRQCVTLNAVCFTGDELNPLKLT